MEVNNHLKLVPTGATVSAEPARRRAAEPSSRPARPEPLPLEQMQQALREIPEIDRAKVAEVREALRRGEIAADPARLAAAMLLYHRGSGA